MPENIQVKLASRPVGLPTAENWTIESSPLPEVGDGQLLIQQAYVSLDPAMRSWISAARTYLPPVPIGAVMRAGAVGKVIASQHADYAVGDYVYGSTGVQQYALSDGEGLFKVQTGMVPLSNYLGVMGMTGFTAYFGMLHIGEPKEGDVVLVSGAAGAVGSIAGQIAKIKGCHVVGVAGGPEKCRYLTEELGFDAAIDYKSENLRAAVKRHCPKGIDIYFDNVGGEILDIALSRLRIGARIPLCGGISQYNATEAIQGPSNYLALISCRAKMQGFLVFDFAKDYAKAALELGMWLAQGQIKSRETIVEGIETFPDTFLRLFNGDKLGKLVLKVGAE
ncbi:MAG: NADP-dependent oxidoreductase [Bacteroidota bacterium]